MTEIKANSTIGQIQIADDVIAVIAGTAAMEIDGVAGLSGNIKGDFAEIIGKRNFSRGVKVAVSEKNVEVDLNILVKFGYKIHEISESVQKRVKTAIETMTGLPSGGVNIFVTGIVIEKERPKDKTKTKEKDKTSKAINNPF